MSVRFEADRARDAIERLPELAAQESLTPPDLSGIYVPAQHPRALGLDVSVVVGMRGAGKSLWTAVLASDRHREFVAAQIGASSLDRITARVAFGLDETETDFPGAHTLGVLLAQQVEPIDIWHTVVLRHSLVATNQPLPFAERNWVAAIRWAADNRAVANDLMTRCDAALAGQRRVLLVLFDAFDRLGGDWARVRRLTSGALQLGLRLRARQAIRAKFFVRPDLEDDDEVWSFADSSKLRHTKVDLAWTSPDLYGLIFMRLGNDAEFGEAFRAITAECAGSGWTEREQVHLAPIALSRDEEVQRKVIEALADRTMGSGPKRGYTWSWIPLHLADAKGRISPRSYLIAFKTAALDTAIRRPDHLLALQYVGIQQGVVKASEVRVDEIGEDYPWVKPLLEAARGSVVPISAAELAKRWSRERLNEMEERTGTKLPPRRFSNDPLRAGSVQALIDDLVELAVLYRMRDGRLNMPDIFRVGFGILRKGGVRPPH